MNKVEEKGISTGIYKVLSELYREPREETKRFLEALEELTEHDQRLYQMAKSLSFFYAEALSRDVNELKVDYANLFIGPFQVKAPPYGSVYLEGHKRVMGESTHEVIKFYRSCGLQLEDDFKEPPDHISAELEFIYYLNYQGLQTGEPSYFHQSGSFESTFVHPWIGAFTEDVKKNATTDFYKELGSFTEEFFGIK